MTSCGHWDSFSYFLPTCTTAGARKMSQSGSPLLLGLGQPHQALWCVKGLQHGSEECNTGSQADIALRVCAQQYPTLCNPVDCSPPGSSVHGVSQARILEWVTLPTPGDLPDTGIEPQLLHPLHWQVDCLPLHHPGSPVQIVTHCSLCDHRQVSEPLVPSYFPVKKSWLIIVFTT